MGPLGAIMGQEEYRVKALRSPDGGSSLAGESVGYDSTGNTDVG